MIDHYILNNCFNRDIEGKNVKFLKYSPESFFTEVDLFVDEAAFNKLGEAQKWHYESLLITEKEIKEIYQRVLAKLQPIPDVPKTYQIFQKYAELLNNTQLCFYCLDEVDFKLSIQRFKDSFVYFYIHYVENEYFELDLNTIDAESNSWLLSEQFKPVKIKVRKKDIKNNTRAITEEKDLISKIKDGYYFYGYENSVYDYDKFDSLPEKQLADYVNHLIQASLDTQEPFWVRNERNIFFEYGTHKYFPDFILFYNKIIYVIEVKGELFSNVKKNRLLLELNNVPGIGRVNSYKGVVIFQLQMKKLKDFTKSFDEFIIEAEQYFDQVQSKSTIINESEIHEGEKFVIFVPAYDAGRAYKKFIQGKDTKPNGWLPVKTKLDGYSSSIFATMIKNDDLGAELKNKWILFDSVIPDLANLVSNEILCSHPVINDDVYSNHITIKKFQLKEVETKIGIFNEKFKIIILSSSNDQPLIEIKDNLSEFKVIGIKV